MNRTEFLEHLREAEASGVSRSRRILHLLRGATSEPWFDARMCRRLKSLGSRCDEPLTFAPPPPFAAGETWLLVVDGARQGTVVRARATTAAAAQHPVAPREVALAIRGLAAAATRKRKSIPSDGLGAALEVPGVPLEEIQGGSLGLSTCVAVLSFCTRTPARVNVAASALVNADGKLEPVEHLETKCVALREQWPAVSTVVIATGQRGIPSLEGLRIVELAHLEEALKEFGLDLDLLPSPSVDELEKRLTALEVDERHQHSSSEWVARATDACEIAKRLRTERNSKWPRAQILAALMASHAGDHELAVSMLDSADDALIRRLALRARKQLVLASCTIDRQPERALATATAAFEIAAALEDEDHEELFGLASGTLGRVLMHRGDLEAAEPMLRAAYEHHHRVARHEACRSACYLACCHRLMGQSEAAVELASVALAEAQSLQDQFDAAKTTIAFARLERGRALESLGRYAEAVVELEQVVAINRSAESYPRLGAERSLASVFRATSQLDEARAHLAACKRVARGDAPLTLRKVGAVAAAEELRSAGREGRPTLLPQRDLEDAWRVCFGDDRVDVVLRTWIY